LIISEDNGVLYFLATVSVLLRIMQRPVKFCSRLSVDTANVSWTQ